MGMRFCRAHFFEIFLGESAYIIVFSTNFAK